MGGPGSGVCSGACGECVCAAPPQTPTGTALGLHTVLPLIVGTEPPGVTQGGCVAVFFLFVW